MARTEQHTVLITGGGTGIGRALAKALHARGHRVAICGRRETALRDAAAAMPGAWWRSCDVADEKSVQGLVDALASDGLRVSMLVNNAAILSAFDLGAPGGLDIAAVKRDLASNLAGPIQLTNALLPRLLECARPTIVNINSPGGIVPVARFPIYSASKAGLHSYSLSLRRHLRGRVRVVEVFPPSVDTAMDPGIRRCISADDCAARILRGLDRGKDEIWIGDAMILRVLSILKPFSVFAIVNDYQR
jgi:uncharacterized oxidoreductase